MSGWDYTTTGTPGLFVARRDGAEAATVAMLPDVELQTLRMHQWVAMCNELDETHETDALYRRRGWVSKSEHDFLWREARLEAHGQEPARRAYLNDMWKGEGFHDPVRRPLTRLEYDRWRSIMAVACEPRSGAA